MSIKYAILGLLSRAPMSGYDLKKMFAALDILYWSGNNNQIYTALLELHKAGWVSREVKLQEDNPPRKEYSLTEDGRVALHRWLRSEPDLPQIRHPLLVQLLWADLLSPPELDELLSSYEEEVQVKVLMLREEARRKGVDKKGTARETFLWRMIGERWLAIHEEELLWARALRESLRKMTADKE
jgi:DNA-binding PadR family transcriptional regulator